MLFLTNRLAAGGVRQKIGGTRIFVRCYRAAASVKLTPHDVGVFIANLVVLWLN